MAAEHWFRWHHGTVTDPKWRTVASRASRALSRAVTVGHVVSVWAAMLECASQANPRGNLVGWSDEDVAAGLGFEEEDVRAIREAMQGKTLEADALIAWDTRQIKREDATAADRKRAQRERETKAKSLAVTHEDATSRTVTLETETEERQKGSPPKPPASAGGTDRPRKKGEGITFAAFVQACRASGDKPLPRDHAVFDFATDAGIPVEFLELAWREFARQYRGTKKTQAGVAGWRQKFENCVRRNWYKLWWFPQVGTCELTTAGVQLRREREAEEATKSEPGEAGGEERAA